MKWPQNAWTVKSSKILLMHSSGLESNIDLKIGIVCLFFFSAEYWVTFLPNTSPNKSAAMLSPRSRYQSNSKRGWLISHLEHPTRLMVASVIGIRCRTSVWNCNGLARMPLAWDRWSVIEATTSRFRCYIGWARLGPFPPRQPRRRPYASHPWHKRRLWSKP